MKPCITVFSHGSKKLREISSLNSTQERCVTDLNVFDNMRVRHIWCQNKDAKSGYISIRI